MHSQFSILLSPYWRVFSVCFREKINSIQETWDLGSTVMLWYRAGIRDEGNNYVVRFPGSRNSEVLEGSPILKHRKEEGDEVH